MASNNACLVCSNETQSKIQEPIQHTRYCDSCMKRHKEAIITIRSKDTHYSICRSCYERYYNDPFWCVDHQHNYCYICNVYTAPHFQLIVQIDSKPRSFLSTCNKEHFDTLCNKMIQLRATTTKYCAHCTINYATSTIQLQTRQITDVTNSWLTLMPPLSWLGLDQVSRIEETTF
jgi:hypothetical protein